MALTNLTNKGELPQKRKHPHKGGRAYTQVNSGVLAKIFTVDTDVIGNKRSRMRLIHDESMPTANVPIRALESTHCSRNYPNSVHLSRSLVGMESPDDSLCYSPDSDDLLHYSIDSDDFSWIVLELESSSSGFLIPMATPISSTRAMMGKSLRQQLPKAMISASIVEVAVLV